MQGVTAALVAFIFVCVVFPNIVRVKPQFYAGLTLVCGIIVLDALGLMLGASGLRVFAYFLEAIFQVGAIGMLFLACGGLSFNELTAEMGNVFEAIRRGEQKPVKVPLTGEQPKPRPEKVSDPIVIPAPPGAAAASPAAPAVAPEPVVPPAPVRSPELGPLPIE